MTTAPYATIAAEAVKGSLEHVAEIIVDPTGGASFTLPWEDLQVTFAEDWTPHIQASITAPVPSAVQLDLLDARINCRLRINAGYRYQNGTLDVQPLADLGLRTRGTRRPDNTVPLTASSDEARAQDRRRSEATALPAFTGINALVQWFANYSIYPATATVVSDFPAAQGATAVAGITAEVGQPMWDTVADAAARAGVWVHCAADRTWKVRYRAVNGATPQHVLEVGKNGTIEETDSKIERGPWANQSIIEYAWTDAAGVDHKIYGRARISSGPYSVDVVGYKTDHIVINRAVTQSQADAAAATRVGQLVTRGRSISLRAHSAYWLRPGMTVTVKLLTGPAVDHIIQSITFDLGTGFMQIETRQPLDATITTGE